MNGFSRREFVFLSSGTVAGNVFAAGVAEAAEAEGHDFSDSGLVTGQPKPLKHESIPGFLSAEQIAPHTAESPATARHAGPPPFGKRIREGTRLAGIKIE